MICARPRQFVFFSKKSSIRPSPWLVSSRAAPHLYERFFGLSKPNSKRVFLLRKEVIQPHLPIRLPCYDFTLVIDFTFDSSPPCGLGHWLRAPPTSMV